MDREQAKRLIIDTFENPFNKDNFTLFLKNLLKSLEEKKFEYKGNYIPDAFQEYIISLERIGQYTFDDKEIDLLIVTLKKETSLERARTAQRNFIAWYLKGGRSGKLKDGALVAFVSPDSKDWRFSLVKMDYRFEETHTGKVKVKEEFTPAKRWSFLVGKNEKSHTAQSRFLPILQNDEIKPTLEDLEKAFDVEVVTEEFFEAYKYSLNEVIINSLDKGVDYNKRYTYAQQLLSRILFIYFLQRKKWLKWKNYEQDTSYIKNLWWKYKEYIAKNKQKKDAFYSSWLSSLFFGAFNKKSHLIDKALPEDIQESFRIMPFLNGGLFSRNPLDKLDLKVPDSVFEWLFEPDSSSNDKKKGFLEIFNFTIDESLPIDTEIAVDPEMLGKVYESLIAESERGSVGIFYTHRIEIDLMCRLSLIEYLADKTKISKDKIINFVYEAHNNVSQFSKDELTKIKVKLDNLKVVDPAVGSSSFLVGMLNILVELHTILTKEIEGKDENLFALKQRIIQQNLYGVDVKEWAVMVGELRLWLSLVIETEEKYMDIYTKPLLPNLSFKIRQGDSLVEEIGGVQLSLRGEPWKYLPKSVETKIKELIDRKNAFFSGQRSSNLNEIEEIEKLEHNIFTEILESKIDELSNKISFLEKEKNYLDGQMDIFGNEDISAKEKIKKIAKQIDQLSKEKEKYISGLTNLKSKTQKEYFLWEVDFAEVFADGGFDIVIGNPPYVRQELIAPPLENQNNYEDEEWKELKSKYKEKLISSVKNIWKDVGKIDKRSDLYVFFYYHGLSLLKEGGIFCFINSNSWLDVGYGAGLQEFLLKNMKPLYIIDNLKKRSFKQADVNTVIVLIERPEKKLDDYTIKFVAFKKPFEQVVNAEVLKKIEKTNQPVFDDEDFRIYPKTKMELLAEGVEIEDNENKMGFEINPENLPYIGNKWGGKYLRAPEIYFKILEKGKDKLVRLGDIAEVRFGIKTGANDFFHLKPVGMTVKEVVEISEKNPDALIPVQNAAGWEGEIEAKFLKPVIKSPRELKTITVRLEDLNYLVFMCHDEKSKLKGTNALEYIEWGEQKNYHKRSTCKGRRKWWDLGMREGARIIVSAKIGERYVIYLNTRGIVEDKILYGVIPIEDKNSQEISILLNSMLCRLEIEINSRQLTGAQAIADVDVNVWDNIKLLNIGISEECKIDEKILYRPIYSIFTELGFDPKKPIREQEPNPLPDRKALDDIVFDALGLTEEERKEVYWAVAELVKNRLDKAKSV
jgi:hypothetical protein